MTSGEAVWFQSVILDLDGKKAITAIDLGAEAK